MQVLGSRDAERHGHERVEGRHPGGGEVRAGVEAQHVVGAREHVGAECRTAVGIGRAGRDDVTVHGAERQADADRRGAGGGVEHVRGQVRHGEGRTDAVQGDVGQGSGGLARLDRRVAREAPVELGQQLLGGPTGGPHQEHPPEPLLVRDVAVGDPAGHLVAGGAHRRLFAGGRGIGRPLPDPRVLREGVVEFRRTPRRRLDSRSIEQRRHRAERARGHQGVDPRGHVGPSPDHRGSVGGGRVVEVAEVHVPRLRNDRFTRVTGWFPPQRDPRP
ncbi:hypothetical protein QP157_04650 [Sphingomonas sp. LR61]